ncbi:MAG: methyltransferase domain-containing protein [Patescibacteria group bacterium]
MVVFKSVIKIFIELGILNQSKSGKLIDIGSGDGKEAALFQGNGFEVTLIDLKNGIDATTYLYPKEEYDIAIARNSLPFMKDKQFDVINNIYKTLKTGGYFYGTVFGSEDPWAKEELITPINFQELTTFLNKLNFKIIWQSEEKGIDKTMKGDLKDWHVFKFLVRK